MPHISLIHAAIYEPATVSVLFYFYMLSVFSRVAFSIVYPIRVPVCTTESLSNDLRDNRKTQQAIQKLLHNYIVIYY